MTIFASSKYGLVEEEYESESEEESSSAPGFGVCLYVYVHIYVYIHMCIGCHSAENNANMTWDSPSQPQLY